jgi:ABC-type tungstate transport system substrate-binding protein
VLSADPALIAIVRLSLIVSLSAVLLAALIGVPFGAFLALVHFPGREAVDGFTRVMTTAIALETSKGDLPLAIGLGLVLIAIVVTVNAAAWGLRRAGERFAG